MWNWKLMHEDNEVVCYCDIDSISDPEADEDGVYPWAEFCQPTPKRVAAWMSFFIKDRGVIRYYIEQRDGKGLPIEGYEDFSNVLCIVQIDSEKGVYRVIPAMDYDNKGNGLSQSTALDDEGKSLFKGKLRGDWSPIQPRKTHKAIHALVKFVYG